MRIPARMYAKNKKEPKTKQQTDVVYAIRRLMTPNTVAVPLTMAIFCRTTAGGSPTKSISWNFLPIGTYE